MAKGLSNPGKADRILWSSGWPHLGKVTLSGSTGQGGIRRYRVNNEFEHLVVRLRVLVQGAAPAPMWTAAAMPANGQQAKRIKDGDGFSLGINNSQWAGRVRGAGTLVVARINNSRRGLLACHTHAEKRGGGNKEPGYVRDHRGPRLVKGPVDDEGNGAQEVRRLEGRAGF
jgi:hypothetical protein